MKRGRLVRAAVLTDLLLLLLLLRLPPAACGAGPEKTPIPNRLLPAVAVAQPGWNLSAQPDVEELSRAWIFDQRLVPIGPVPAGGENAALAVALRGHTGRRVPDDFTSLKGFLDRYGKSPWRAAVLTGLGLEYYHAAYYSRALEVWQEAWSLSQNASEAPGRLLADRVAGELAGLYSRLGRMDELEALLQSVERRPFVGGATERMSIAREVLATMKAKPEVCFRCGPLALQSIKRSREPLAPVELEIFSSASSHRGFSLPQVAALSVKVGLGFQMAFRTSDDFVVPSVVHWKAGHFAAIVQREGDRYLLEDPTFGTAVWASRAALEDEASGYFLIPPGPLPRGWRSVGAGEGGSIWGRGTPALSDRDIYGRLDLQTGSCSLDSTGMPVSSVHLMLVNLQVRDTPVGYTPPVGPPVRFTLRYNHRDHLQQPGDVQRLLGPKWTHDWNESLQPFGNDMRYLVGGGGARTFTKFNATTETYAPNLYDQTLLRRISPNVFEMTWPDGSKRRFGPLRGASGILLSSVSDPAGNTVTLTYDQRLRLVALTDAIGQVTTLSYDHPTNPDLITKVTDPFGRAAWFEYRSYGFPTGGVNPGCTNLPAYLDLDFLVGITDVLGLKSTLVYEPAGSAPTNHSCDAKERVSLATDTLLGMVTPYGNTSFRMGGGTNSNHTLYRYVETRYPDGSNDRVEYNQSDTLGIPMRDPEALVPAGMPTFNAYLYGRNTFYWSRTADASSRGDHSKAKVFHWLHADDLASTAGVLESTKEPLENRVWFNYPGGGGMVPGTSIRRERVGRVLDDGQTQIYTAEYNSFGHPTRTVDPAGRTFRMVYATNGIDLLEVRQTRGDNNELLFRASYNDQHRPVTVMNAGGQTHHLTYNERGQLLTVTDAKGATTTFSYDAEGKPFSIDGPLPGAIDLTGAKYDAVGRIRTLIGMRGYTLNIEYDDLDRVTRIIHPDGTSEQYSYDRLDLVGVRDRAGRETRFEYDAVRQLKKQTDPLGQVTRFEWCRCGQMRSLTDPMGNTTTWLTDIQGRTTGKRFPDGSEIAYVYERTTSRLRFLIDAKEQAQQFEWNLDDTLQSIAHHNSLVPTPGVSFQYDRDYRRVTAMTDATGITRYSYYPITPNPSLGAGALAGVDGPLPHDTIQYFYDELGRNIHRTIDGAGMLLQLDAARRMVGLTNVLGEFSYGYDGGTAALVSGSAPGGLVEERQYGSVQQDLRIQRLTHKVGATPVSESLYGHDVAMGRITSWSQQAGAQPPNRFTLSYDGLNRLVSATVTNSGVRTGTFGYSYDPVGNRLTEQVGSTVHTATYNALNEIRSTTAPANSRTNEWDAMNRLVAVNQGNQRTEFYYDGLSRLAGIRKRVDGAEVSHRRFVWDRYLLAEERDADGVVIKRFFPQGMTVERGPAAGAYFYTRDHLGSIRALTDATGAVRARYEYDPFGRRTRVSGDVESDFGFVGMFHSSEANLLHTHYRVYDPELGRWLSRDPMKSAEASEGPNLYAYVGNEPISRRDPSGLGLTTLDTYCGEQLPQHVPECAAIAGTTEQVVEKGVPLLEAAPTAIPAANNAIQCVRNTAPAIENTLEAAIGRFQTLPGIGSDTVNVLSKTGEAVSRVSANVTPNLRDMALAARQAAANIGSLEKYPDMAFWQRWMDASRHWREYELTQEQAQEVVMWISRWTDFLFSK